VRDREEGRQEREAALHLVRLHRLLANEAGQKVAASLERGAKIVPRAREGIGLDPSELEVVDAAEKAQRDVPCELIDELLDDRLRRTAAREARVDRRAGGLELLRLPAKDR
jgi:hypothetical protein